MSLLDDMKNMTTEEIVLIIEDQADLYSKEELELFSNELKNRQEKELLERKSRLPNEIRCVKCGGSNSPSAEICEFCGCRIPIEEILDLPWEIYNNKEQYSTMELQTASKVFENYGQNDISFKINNYINNDDSDDSQGKAETSKPKKRLLIWSIICELIGVLSFGITSSVKNGIEYQLAKGTAKLGEIFGQNDFSDEIYINVQTVDLFYSLGIILMILGGILFFIYLVNRIVRNNMAAPDPINTETIPDHTNVSVQTKNFCNHCGHKLNTYDRFCANCGNKL